MMEFLIKTKNILNRALEWVVIAATGTLVVVVVWQVVSRYVLNSPSSWSEELAIIMLIWMSLLGASVAFVKKSHLGVDFFVNKLPENARKKVELLVHLIVAFFAASVLLYGGGRIVYLTLQYGQRSPALGLEMGLVYLALPVSGFFILIFSIEQIVVSLNNIGKEGA